MGPTLIFDKSALQGLSVNESLWLDTFFNCNITPIFWVETLADLEKDLKKKDGRSAEDIVGNLALKTPEQSAKVNVHHESLLTGELLEGIEIDMRYGRVVISSGHLIELEGKKGVVFRPSREEEAFSRWQDHQFIDLERLTAKQWRTSLSKLNLRAYAKMFSKLIEGNKPRNMKQAKALAEYFLDLPDQKAVFEIGLYLVGADAAFQAKVLSRWIDAGSPSIRIFAPYFSHVFLVDLCFFIGIESGLISAERPSHKIDLSYLYYLPFCEVFCSEDRLHSLLLPLFLRDFQIFLKGSELKSDLKRLNDYYSVLPDEVKNLGVASFAQHPPLKGEFKTSELWDKFLPAWRNDQRAVPSQYETDIVVSEDWQGLDAVAVGRSVCLTRGDWKRFPSSVVADTHSLV
jgi:hypothetical protein